MFYEGQSISKFRYCLQKHVTSQSSSVECQGVRWRVVVTSLIGRISALGVSVRQIFSTRENNTSPEKNSTVCTYHGDVYSKPTFSVRTTNCHNFFVEIRKETPRNLSRNGQSLWQRRSEHPDSSKMGERVGRRTCLQDEQRSGRPVSVTTRATVEAVQMLVAADRRVRISDITEELEISFGTAQKLLTEDLKMKKLCAKWIPQILTEEQKGLRMNICCQHRRGFRRDPTFLQRIVAADETWVHSFEPELKRQSAEWTAEGEERPMKARRSQWSFKVMHITFFDHLGILVDWPVPPGTSVNGHYYQWVLREKLKPVIRKKRPN